MAGGLTTGSIVECHGCKMPFHGYCAGLNGRSDDATAHGLCGQCEKFAKIENEVCDFIWSQYLTRGGRFERDRPPALSDSAAWKQPAKVEIGLTVMSASNKVREAQFIVASQPLSPQTVQ